MHTLRLDCIKANLPRPQIAIYIAVDIKGHGSGAAVVGQRREVTVAASGNLLTRRTRFVHQLRNNLMQRGSSGQGREEQGRGRAMPGA